jgi:hypothetical protein
MISQEIVKELLDYNFETGKLTWKERNRKWFSTDRQFKIWNTRFARKEAFTALTDTDYYHGSVLGKKYKAHRIIWLYQTGEWPDEVDHINHDRRDNRWINLREVSHQENHKNSSHRKDNSSGCMGVYFDKERQKWRSDIIVDNKNINLGRFELYEDAVAARKEGEKKYMFHKNHGEKL